MRMKCINRPRKTEKEDTTKWQDLPAYVTVDCVII
jgi:hypothetical protein